MNFIENQEGLADFVYKLDKDKRIYNWSVSVGKHQIFYWHLVRFSLLKLTRLLSVGEDWDTKKNRLSFWNKFKFIINAIKYRPRDNARVDVLFLTPGIGDIDRGDYIENIYHNFFAHEIDNFGMKVGMLHQPAMKPFNAKKRHFNISSLNWIYIKIMIFSKIKRLKRSQTQDIDSFTIFLKKALTPYLSGNNLNSCISTMSKYIKRKLKQLPLEIYYWERIFNRYRPKFLIAQDVSYCGMTSVISLVAKSKGITVIEGQHGVILDSHIGYNYFCDNHYLDFLPDYLWGYGKKWLQGINLPIKKIVMGNPFLEEAKMRDMRVAKQYSILFISNRVDGRELPQIILKFADKIDNILSRPHPTEFDQIYQAYNELFSKNNITLDSSRDVMLSIAKSKMVVVLGNSLSAVTFEALALGAKVAIIADTRKTIMGLELIKDYIKVFDHRDSELVDKVQALLNEKTVQYNTDDLYAPNWRQNIRDFFAGQLKIS